MKPLKFFNIFLLILVTFALCIICVNAQLDSTFGTNGTVVLGNVGTKPLASFVLPSGKILIISEELTNPQTFQPYRYNLIRLNANGTPDTTYGANGIVTLTGLQSSQQFSRFFNCTRQTDGKILCLDLQSVYRFNEDGTLDSTFAGDGVHTPNVDQQASEKLAAVIQQPDGKIVVAGMIVINYSEPSRLFLVRYETDGSLDQTFGDQGGFIIHNLQYPTVSEVHLQSTGKILTVPQKESSASNGNYFFAGAINRFNTNGTIDNTFTPVIYQAGNTPKLRSFKLLGNDKFATAESITINDQLLRSQRNIVVNRYTSEGNSDITFGTDGNTNYDVTSAMTDDAIALGEQPDGNIIISGATNIEYNRTSTSGLTLSIARLNQNGTLIGKYLATNINNDYTSADPTLLYDGQILVQSDGKVLTTSTKIAVGGTPQILLTRSTNIPLEIKRLHGIPYNFLENNNRSNPGIYRPSTRNWYFNPSIYSVFFGLNDDILTPADFVGDFKTDLAVFRPSEGNWYIAKQGFNPAQNYLTIPWGKAGDIPIPRDYDGDSKTDIAVFRPADGVWYIRNSSNTEPTLQKWGIEGDKPVAGDFDGDGIDDIAVFRPSNGNWYISQSSDSKHSILHFGASGDIPVQEDYDGDNKVDVAVWRPSTGVWYIRRSSDNGFSIYRFGLTGDIPIPCDYDGDRKIDIGVWRTTNQNWYIINSGDSSFNQFIFGLTNDIPTQGRN
ncbi:MAG TPA: hypothetical protein PKE69_04785 [Pyrinomonadaceae bacterium]|nr:hypothetical protein [Pyrinomonadaceae bacterium]